MVLARRTAAAVVTDYIGIGNDVPHPEEGGGGRGYLKFERLGPDRGGYGELVATACNAIDIEAIYRDGKVVNPRSRQPIQAIAARVIARTGSSLNPFSL